MVLEKLCCPTRPKYTFRDGRKICGIVHTHACTGGLLTEQWDKDAVFEGAKVIFTLLDPQGGGFSGEALGRDGTWIIKAAQTIPTQVVVSKLYYKTGGSGFTLFEFHLNKELQVHFLVLFLLVHFIFC
jgi:hypothetical protein